MESQQNPAVLLNTEQAAAMLGYKKITLAVWRTKGKGPPFLKMDPAKAGAVRYRSDDLKAWLDGKAEGR